MYVLLYVSRTQFFCSLEIFTLMDYGCFHIDNPSVILKSKQFKSANRKSGVRIFVWKSKIQCWYTTKIPMTTYLILAPLVLLEPVSITWFSNTDQVHVCTSICSQLEKWNELSLNQTRSVGAEVWTFEDNPLIVVWRNFLKNVLLSHNIDVVQLKGFYWMDLIKLWLIRSRISYIFNFMMVGGGNFGTLKWLMAAREKELQAAAPPTSKHYV